MFSIYLANYHYSLFFTGKNLPSWIEGIKLDMNWLGPTSIFFCKIMLLCLILRFAMPNPSPLNPIHDCANGYFLGERKVCVWKTDFATRVEAERREIHIHRHHHCRFSQEPHMWPTRCCITQETRLRPRHSFLASKKTTYIIYVWLNCLAWWCCL